MGRFGQNPHASVLVDGLTKELEKVIDPRRRSPILYALTRLLERRPGKRDIAYAYLDEVRTLNPDQEDLAFEAWRAAYNRAPEKKQSALDAVLPYLTDIKDIAHCRLLRAELVSGPGAEEKVLDELNRATAVADERRELIWARAFIGKETDPVALSEAFETLATLTKDTVMAAALLLETACLCLTDDGWRNETDADPATLLMQVLEKPNLDWTLLFGVYRTALDIHRPDIAALCFDRLANSTRSPKTKPKTEKPPGHYFNGLKTDKKSAAAYAWFRSVLERKCCKNMDNADAALTAARKLMPNNIALTIEQALLQEALGAPRKAFETVFMTDLPPERKALTALGAGRPEEAFRFGVMARDTDRGGLLGQALTEAAAETSPPPPPMTDTDVRLAWLEANMSHPDARAVMERLRRDGVSRPYFRLFDEEALDETHSVLAVMDGADADAPWVHLFRAVLGPLGGRGEGFSRFADSTDDPILKALLLRCGAIFKQEEGAPSDDIENLSRRADTFATAKDHPEIRFTPSDIGWQKALEKLEDERDTNNPLERELKIALINRFATSDMAAAREALVPLFVDASGGTAARLLNIEAAVKDGDWQTAVDTLEMLATALPDERDLFELLLGELYLTVSQSYQDALNCFDRAGHSKNADIADVASIYRLITLHQLNEKEAIHEAMASETPKPNSLDQDTLFGDLFDDEDTEPRDRQAMKRLEGYGTETPQQWIAKMAFTPMDPANAAPYIDDAARNLERIAEAAGDSPTGDSFRVAASLLTGRPFTPSGQSVAPESDATTVDIEHLYYTDPFLLEDSDLVSNRRVTALKSDLPHNPGDPEWIELMLNKAETEAADGEYDLALESLHEALAFAPDNPGLLETQAETATLAGRFAEAADTHGRLAGFYDSEEAMIHHLAQAALILYDQLDNAHGARNICREAIRRSPEHAEANEIISYIMDACADLPNSDTELEDIEHRGGHHENAAAPTKDGAEDDE